jgi:hypothetical protein
MVLLVFMAVLLGVVERVVADKRTKGRYQGGVVAVSVRYQGR